MAKSSAKAADWQDPLIVIASNRGPFAFQRETDGAFMARRGAGGLVTALSTLAERHEVLWVASAMSDEDRQWASAQPRPIQHVEGINLRLIQPDRDAYDLYYNRIANPLLWFIQHQLWDTPRQPTIDGQTWHAWQHGYTVINRQFARAIADSVRQTQRPVIVFPQDYQLYLVPGYLRHLLGNRVQIQPFHHIPWPGPDAWRILPRGMRDAVLYSQLSADRIGFQTQRDAFNFVQTCRFYLPDAHSRGARDSITYDDRVISARAYPISVDVERLEALVDEPEVRLQRAQVHNSTGDRKLILRVDRVEPSKNILRSLVAYRALLEAHPEHHDRVQMLALLVPSRLEVYEYQSYLSEIMAEAGLINAEFSDGFWEPVRIVVGDNYHRAIAALQLYDVLLVNPLADGMNLVAKEGALVNQRDGVLLLSEFAGAFYELGDHALIVPPFDIHSTMDAMHRALTMPADERQQRAEALRQIVRQSGVQQWFQMQVADALDAMVPPAT